MSWWVVTGRRAFDDEDTALVLQADTQDDVIAQFVARLRGEDDEPTDDEDERREIYVNVVVRCGTHEPTITYGLL